MKWKSLAQFLVKYAPLIVEAILREKAAKDTTIATNDGRTVRLIEVKPRER